MRLPLSPSASCFILRHRVALVPLALFALRFSLTAFADPAPAAAAAPFPYVPATAYHILPETTSEESGYFSLNEGLDGKIYVGAAKYGVDAYLVEFDPATGRQRVVVDTNKVTGATGRGYAAQAKIHTRNFTGPSGRIYIGSKQGYRLDPADKSDYPGGYAMIYDPRADTAESLGMPFPGQGIIDTVADESRGLLYIVTCEDQHWMRCDLRSKACRELGPLLTPYASTLVDRRGVASALTADFQLAQYDPRTDNVTVRPVLLDGAAWARKNKDSIPTWNLAPDGRTAFLILMNDPTLITIDLGAAGATAPAKAHGKLIAGQNPDSRSSLVVDPKGIVWAVVRVDNTTGFGTGYLHHLVRYDPGHGEPEDLGVIAVKNPDYVDWTPSVLVDGKPRTTYRHGFHRLPDGTLTILHAHMGLIAAHDGTLYMTALYPYTLLRIEGCKTQPPPEPSPGGRYVEGLLQKLDGVEAQLPAIEAAAAVAADRYLKGGNFLIHGFGGTLEQELSGRAGGLMSIPARPAGEQDIGLLTWDHAPAADDLERKASACKAAGLYVLGIAPGDSAPSGSAGPLADAWFSAGKASDVASVPVVNAVLGWTFTAELISALSRKGKMPVMWLAFFRQDGRDWWQHYRESPHLHDDLAVPPIEAGVLGRQYLERARYGLRRLAQTQLPLLQKDAAAIVAESGQGRKTVVAYDGHMGMAYVGRNDDAAWAAPHELSEGVESEMHWLDQESPENALVLRLGNSGLHETIDSLFQKKRDRVLLLSSENPRREWSVPDRYAPWVDYGAPFGDACVEVPGYTIRALPISGITQTAAYEVINAEVQAATRPKPLR